VAQAGSRKKIIWCSDYVAERAKTGVRIPPTKVVGMTNQEIIAAVERWQTDARLYPLTCCTSTTHAPLEPIEKGGQIVLACPNCDYCQAAIPDMVLEWNGDLSWLLGIAR
jgi:hypothetical protein